MIFTYWRLDYLIGWLADSLINRRSEKKGLSDDLTNWRTEYQSNYLLCPTPLRETILRLCESCLYIAFFWHQPIKHHNIVKLAKNGWPNAYIWLKIDGLILHIFCTLSGWTGSVTSITFMSLYVVFIGFQNFTSICIFFTSALPSLPIFGYALLSVTRFITNWTSFTCPFDVGSLRAPERKRGTPIRHGNKHVFEMKVGQLWPTDIQRILVILKMIWFFVS